MKTLPTIIITAATPVMNRIGSPLNGLFNLDEIPAMWWDEELEEDIRNSEKNEGSDDEGGEEGFSVLTDSFDSSNSLSSPSETPCSPAASPPITTFGFFSVMGLGKGPLKRDRHPEPKSEQVDSPGFGMSSSFSSMCLSDYNKGATAEEQKALDAIANAGEKGREGESDTEEEKDEVKMKVKSEECSKIVLFLVFLLGFFVSVYGVTVFFLSPILPPFSALLGFPSFTIDALSHTISQATLFPAAYWTSALRFAALSRASLLLSFIWLGDAASYRERQAWQCRDRVSSIIKVYVAMRQDIKNAFVSCVHSEPKVGGLLSISSDSLVDVVSKSRQIIT